MMKDFLKKLGKQQEPEDLDTGYDSDYYGGAYAHQPVQNRPEEPVTEDRYDDRFERDLYNRDRGSYEEDNRFYRDMYAQSMPVAEEAVPMPAAAEPEPEEMPVNAGTLYYTPETYRDCREAIVSGLSESHVVVVNVKNLAAADAVRLFDYIMGAVLALEADMTRLNHTTLLLAPKDVEVTEDDLRSLFAPKDTVADTVIEEEGDEIEYGDEIEDDFIGYGDLPDEDMSI